ncbi:MAG: SAM-dependent chlorinase/fluorinase [Candidatus Eisenbacteria bacterium]|nr:SAM-dependent chlorinase/fluorinase [Candidatus Eisenbacteria bacterium]MCC7143557.1 SAM-dependent chlorinase/fluorinase [Candidatus Eisenbacteria bacterium]
MLAIGSLRRWLPARWIAAMLVCVSSAPPARAQTPAAPQHPTTIALLTDLGMADGRVGLAHGVLLARTTGVEIIDLSHAVAPGDLQTAGMILRETKRLPPNSLIVVCVGSASPPSRWVAFRTQRGFYYLGPDNGVFSWVLKDQSVFRAAEVRPGAINPNWQPGDPTLTDLLAPAAAMLATTGDVMRVGDAALAATFVRIDPPATVVAPATHEVVARIVSIDAARAEVGLNLFADELRLAGIQPGDPLEVAIVPPGSERPSISGSLRFVAQEPERDGIELTAWLSPLGALRLRLSSTRDAEAISAEAEISIRAR